MCATRKTRLLAVGDACVSTGFARVSASVLSGLCETHDILQLGLKYDGREHAHPWRILPVSKGDEIGEAQIAGLVGEFDPDVLWMLGDPWRQSRWLEAIKTVRAKRSVVLYLPIDFGPPPPDVTDSLRTADCVVVFTQFARAAMTAAFATQPDRPAPRLEIIPLGVDTQLFHPLAGRFDPNPLNASRKRARSRLFGDDSGLGDAFIVLNANRNILRKRIDLTVRGFADFAAGKPDNVYLHLHMGSPDLGWDLRRLAAKHAIEDRLIRTERTGTIPTSPVERLNLIYNAASVGVNTSFGEGWGLVNTEHAATGAPQIVPRHTGIGEIWNDAGILLDPVTTLTAPELLMDEHYIDSKDLSAALDSLYRDAANYRAFAARAHRLATSGAFRWPPINARWRGLIHRLHSP